MPIDGAARETGIALNCCARHPSLFLNRKTLNVKIKNPKISSANPRCHNSATPTPFKKIPRMIMIKYLSGIM